MNDHENHITRRDSIARLAGLVTAAMGGSALAAETAGGGPAAVASGAVACVLTPELTEGPFYIAGEKVRRDITEGRPGATLMLHTTVVNASTCKPIKGAAVDIWHCDAGGLYSGVTNAGGEQDATDSRTFLRGIQRTDASGLAVFKTIYPGWYQGRTVHIHVKVHVRGNVVHTGQLFFSDALTDAVYGREPYSSRPNREVRNADDSIYRNGGQKGLVRAVQSGNGYVGRITMGVVAS